MSQRENVILSFFRHHEFAVPQETGGSRCQVVEVRLHGGQRDGRLERVRKPLHDGRSAMPLKQDRATPTKVQVRIIRLGVVSPIGQFSQLCTEAAQIFVP
jgi:hypothetical protein